MYLGLERMEYKMSPVLRIQLGNNIWSAGEKDWFQEKFTPPVPVLYSRLILVKSDVTPLGYGAEATLKASFIELENLRGH